MDPEMGTASTRAAAEIGIVVDIFKYYGTHGPDLSPTSHSPSRRPGLITKERSARCSG